MLGHNQPPYAPPTGPPPPQQMMGNGPAPPGQPPQFAQPPPHPQMNGFSSHPTPPPGQGQVPQPGQFPQPPRPGSGHGGVQYPPYPQPQQQQQQGMGMGNAGGIPPQPFQQKPVGPPPGQGQVPSQDQMLADKMQQGMNLGGGPPRPMAPGQLPPQPQPQMARPPGPSPSPGMGGGFQPPHGGPPQHPGQGAGFPPQQQQQQQQQPPAGYPQPRMGPPQPGYLPSGPTPPMANGPAHPPGVPPQPGLNQYQSQQQPHQMNGYQNQQQYPPAPGAPRPMGQSGYPPQPQQGGYPPQPQQGGYPPQPQQGGYPPQPQPGGYPPMQQPGMPGQPQPAYPQPTQQQPKRLDPDQMPSAIQVMQEDQQTRGGVFVTNQKGLLPPLVTTKFQVDDQGNASPRFIRSTMYSVPALPDMLKQTAIPFALIINPFESPSRDEAPVSCVDLGPIGPVRCIRCKAYMSPLMQFIDGGRRFQCLLCKATTEVPPEYFQHLDHTGQRVDKYERPELMRGTYEFIATAEYCRNNALPKEPAFIFVIDVSYNNIKSGLVNLLCSHIKSLLECLPSHTPVGFITYNSKVHFYNIDPSLAQPQMVIVPDVADMFMPLLTGFLVPRAEAMNSVDALMEQIPAMFADTKETEAVLSSAIVAGMEALKASERVGKLLTFHSSLPVSDSVPNAKLKNREADRKLLGTDKEKVVLTPQTTFYNNLGQECVAAGVSVDLYLFNNSYVDVATIGQVARITGGSVNKYTYFQADIDGPRVVGELQLHLSRPIGFDGVMRVRTSTGVRPVDFFGHYYMSNTTDVELAAIDSQKSIAIEIKHDDKLTDEDGVYIQVALLYTSIFGQRRLRIHNIALNTCTQMADLYRNCELDTIINFLAKQAISKSVDSTPVALREGVINRCSQMLATYRKHCANPSMPGQLILPECLKLLPLYANCVLRSDAVAGNAELTPDDRSWLMYSVMTMGVNLTVHYFYPKLIPIAGPGVTLDNPTPIRCSRDKMSDEYAFLLENGIYIFMWIGSAVSGEWLQNIFGVSNLAQIAVEAITELPDLSDSDESLRLRALIRGLRTERQKHMRLTIIRQRDKLEMVMNKFLVEDRGSDGQPSYVDFLCHMHKEIRNLLNS